jgi:hypothetical protein
LIWLAKKEFSKELLDEIVNVITARKVWVDTMKEELGLIEVYFVGNVLSNVLRI